MFGDFVNETLGKKAPQHALEVDGMTIHTTKGSWQRRGSVIHSATTVESQSSPGLEPAANSPTDVNLPASVPSPPEVRSHRHASFDGTYVKHFDLQQPLGLELGPCVRGTGLPTVRRCVTGQQAWHMVDPAIRAGDALFSIDNEPVTGRRFETIMQMLQEVVQKAKGQERVPKLCLTFAHLALDQSVEARHVTRDQALPSPPHTPPMLPDSHQSQDTYGILAEVAFDHLHPADESAKQTKKPKKSKKPKKEKKQKKALALNGAADELDNVVDNAVDNVGNSIARIRIAASLQQPGRNDAREGHYNRPQNDNQKHLKKKKKKKKKRRETAEK